MPKYDEEVIEDLADSLYHQATKVIVMHVIGVGLLCAIMGMYMPRLIALITLAKFRMCQLP